MFRPTPSGSRIRTRSASSVFIITGAAPEQTTRSLVLGGQPTETRAVA